MNLYQEMLCKLLENERIEVKFPDIPAMVNMVELKCYEALRKIKEILEDHTLSDKECFWKIEEIVLLLEELGSHAGVRHDFG